MKILGIETSCDETAAAIFDSKSGLLSSVVASQIDIHKKTGGVVPEVASRAHVDQILFVIDEALAKAKTTSKNIDLIAVTHAPGLIGSLLVGANTAKALAFSWGKLIMPINHIEGHMYSNFILVNPKLQNTKYKIQIINKIEFPMLSLIVSGGHTSLVLMKDHGEYKTLGETLDDAAGEAFDKVARVLDLPYPGGPEISQTAEEYRRKLQIKNYKPCLPAGRLQTNPKLGDGSFFPRSMLDSGDFNFSFSGIKTSVLYAWRKVEKSTKGIKEMFAYEFEEAVVDILTTKTIKAAEKYKVRTVSICGGVSANKRLREELGNKIEKELPKVNYVVPDIQYSGDNAAMIACLASYKIKKLKKGKIKKLKKYNFEVLSNKDL